MLSLSGASCTATAHAEDRASVEGNANAAVSDTSLPLDADTDDQPKSSATARVHDGFSLRASLGYAAMFDSFKTSNAVGVSGSSVLPTGASFELLAGGTIEPLGTGSGALVIGGGILDIGAGGTTAISFDGTQSKSLVVGAAVAFVDYYFDARKGTHVQALVGPALVGGRCEGSCLGVPQALGVLTGIGIGYDAWIGRQWSLGLLARVDYAHAESSDVRDQHDVWVPTLSLTALYQ
jgi:hypothetical protein